MSRCPVWGEFFYEPGLQFCYKVLFHLIPYCRGSVISTIINILLSISFGIITWSLNAFILRQVSKEVLGTINSRLCLLSSTILFFSRESFRRACQKKPKDDEWTGKISIIYQNLGKWGKSPFIFCQIHCG